MKNLITNLILILAILFLVRLADASEIHITYVVHSKYSKSVRASKPIPKAETSTSDGLSVVERIERATRRTFSLDDVDAMKTIIFRESGFNQYAVNPSSGSCGLGQALPCEKMGCPLSDADCQIDWIMSYVKQRYGTPRQALAWWNAHNWY